MVGDSTNADRPGRTETERVVGETLDRLLAEAQGQRVIIATFSSVLARLQEIMTLAHKHGRKVALTGRSLIENVDLARELGYLDIPDGLLVDVNARIPKHKMVVLSTGSQGEPRSALNQMANDEHRQIKVGQGDLDHHLRRHDSGQRGSREPDAQQAVRARRERDLRRAWQRCMSPATAAATSCAR